MHVELKIEIVTKVVHYSGKWYHWTYNIVVVQFLPASILVMSKKDCIWILKILAL